MSGYGVTYDGVTAATAAPELIVQTVDRDLLPGVRDRYVEVAGLDGSVLFGEADGDRTLEMDCTVKAGSNAERRAAVRNIAGWVRSTGMKRLIVSDEADRFWLAKIEQSTKVTEKVIRGLFTLRWRTSPYAYALTPTVDTATIPNGGGTIAVDVSDSQVEVDPIIELTFSEAAASFSITIGGIELVYDAAVAALDVLTISCPTATLTTGANADAEMAADGFPFGVTLDMFDVSGGFGELGGDGGSDITTDIGCDVRVVWRARFL